MADNLGHDGVWFFFGYNLLCLAYLSVLVPLILSYYKSRPPALVGVAHLVTCDAVRWYHLTVVGLLLSNLVLVPEFPPLHPAAANLLVWPGVFASYMFFLYLTAVVSVQYAHVYFRTPSPFGRLPDGLVRKLVRAAIACTALGICLARLILRCEPRWISHLVRHDVEPCPATYAIANTLMAAAVAANVVLRMLILAEKRQERVWKIFLTGLVIAAAVFVCVAKFKDLEGVDEIGNLWKSAVESRKRRVYLVATVGAALPTLLAIGHTAMRAHLTKKMAKVTKDVEEKVCCACHEWKQCCVRLCASSAVMPAILEAGEDYVVPVE